MSELLLMYTFKEEKDTGGQKKACQYLFFLNFTYFELLSVINKISFFKNRFPGYFLRNAMKEFPPFDVLKL